MRTTRDTWSGKPFRWNTTIILRDRDGGRDGVIVPARESKRGLTWLDASRVEPRLLIELNEGKTITLAPSDAV